MVGSAWWLIRLVLIVRPIKPNRRPQVQVFASHYLISTYDASRDSGPNDELNLRSIKSEVSADALFVYGRGAVPALGWPGTGPRYLCQQSNGRRPSRWVAGRGAGRLGAVPHDRQSAADRPAGRPDRDCQYGAALSREHHDPRPAAQRQRGLSVHRFGNGATLDGSISLVDANWEYVGNDTFRTSAALSQLSSAFPGQSAGSSQAAGSR